MITLRSFESMILFFNGMYKLAISNKPSFDAQVADSLKHNPNLAGLPAKLVIKDRMVKFMNILEKELAEGNDIIAKLESPGHSEIDILTDMADWYTDIQVYCASEAARYGIPVEESQRIVMESNFSKLGVDGEPLYDADNKVMKGPGYWKPEPKLKEMLITKQTE